MPEIRLRQPFRPHRRAAYALQTASCGCWWDSLTGTRHIGEHCESRLTGPRCERTNGCNRPAGHRGDCETGEARYEWAAARAAREERGDG